MPRASANTRSEPSLLPGHLSSAANPDWDGKRLSSRSGGTQLPRKEEFLGFGLVLEPG